MKIEQLDQEPQVTIAQLDEAHRVAQAAHDQAQGKVADLEEKLAADEAEIDKLNSEIAGADPDDEKHVACLATAMGNAQVRKKVFECFLTREGMLDELEARLRQSNLFLVELLDAL